MTQVEGVAQLAADPSAVDGLAEAVACLMPALEQFTAFAQPERTALRRQSWSDALEEPLPLSGMGADAVLAILRDTVIPNGLQSGHPGFSGWVATMPTTVPAAAHLAAALAGPLCVGVQSFNLLESLAARWLGALLGLPDSYQGLFTSGGSVANLIGLGAARQHAAEQLGIDPARDGLGALRRPRIYASDQIHHCAYRNAAVLGLGRRSVAIIPSDATYRMDVAALEQQIIQDRADGYTPVAVIASAGTINTGAIDPLPEISALCKAYGVWLHVDGAYGLLGVLDPALAPLYGDMADLDSVVVDPHKWLATSMGCGGVFVRDRQLLGRAFTLEPAVYVEESQPIYAQDTPVTSQFDAFGYEFQNFGVEHSLPSRGVEVWAVLKEIGAAGVRDRICRHNQFARSCAAQMAESPLFELLAPVTLSTCCFRYIPAELRGQTGPDVETRLNHLNRAVLATVRARSRCMPSATVLGGRFALRACFINPRTTQADVDALITEIEASGAEVWAALR